MTQRAFANLYLYSSAQLRRELTGPLDGDARATIEAELTRRRAPKVTVRLNGAGGELDKLIIPAGSEAGISAAVIALARRCVLNVGDTITITEED